MTEKPGFWQGFWDILVFSAAVFGAWIACFLIFVGLIWIAWKIDKILC